MINLEVKDYCQDCMMFEANVYAYRDENNNANTIVSCEHLFNIDLDDYFDEDGRVTNPDIFEFDEENHFDSYEVLSIMIGVLNFYRKRYLELDAQIKKKDQLRQRCVRSVNNTGGR